MALFVGPAVANFRLNKLSPHYILEKSNFNLSYVWLCDLDIPGEKWLNFLQTGNSLTGV